MSIEQQVIDIGKQMQLETKVCGAELEERLRLGLTGKAAIEHYNAWMKRHHMEHLIVKEDEDPWDKDWHQMEQEVVKLFKEGRPFSEIAAKTGAATQTVKDIIIKHGEE